MQKIIKIENYIVNNENKVKINSKEITKGDIFLALKGNNCHGNDFIKESIKKGAIYCITEKKINFKKNSEKVLIVKNLSKLLVKVAQKKRKLSPEEHEIESMVSKLRAIYKTKKKW